MRHAYPVSWFTFVLVMLVVAGPAGPSAAQTNVVCDTSHGYAAGGGLEFFSEMTDALTAWGYTVVENTDELTAADLSGAALLVTTASWVTSTTYSTAERDVVTAFVAAGGGLFVLSDHPAMNNACLNVLTQPFGITCGVGWMNDYVALASTHPIMAGLGDVTLSIGGTLTVGAGAEVVARNVLNEILIAANPTGGGVVVVGDICFSDFGWNTSRAALCEQALDWLGLDTTAVEAASWARTKALWR